ncbi:MAG: hypothetical protein COT14_00065 [Candidatus Diapherotrites archaeon CG08_land_8_20_14_0_20_30_16]|nr:MAG: hypothetical protein COT14_00065 [Candidatus Diapherotrites archaeon CG08_land_8_20_14_0_20_30_16]
MTGLVISKVKYFSFAKVLAIYGFFMTLIAMLFDLIYKLASGQSYFMPTVDWGSWVLYAIIQLILTPIVMFICAYILAFILNIALKASKGLELETL